jgi:hypothetical protein
MTPKEKEHHHHHRRHFPDPVMPENPQSPQNPNKPLQPADAPMHHPRPDTNRPEDTPPVHHE